MRILDLFESSDLNFSGSITPDLIESKVWLAQTLKDLDQTKFSTIYILGSWYGNLAYILHKMGIEADKIINVELNKKPLEISRKVLAAANIKNVESMLKDANELDYRQLGKTGLVINTSVQDIDGESWWQHIPAETMVVLQDRDKTKESEHKDLSEFNNDFEMNKTMFLDEIELKDPETKYRRFMKIGIK